MSQKALQQALDVLFQKEKRMSLSWIKAQLPSEILQEIKVNRKDKVGVFSQALEAILPTGWQIQEEKNGIFLVRSAKTSQPATQTSKQKNNQTIHQNTDKKSNYNAKENDLAANKPLQNIQVSPLAMNKKNSATPAMLQELLAHQLGKKSLMALSELRKKFDRSNTQRFKLQKKTLKSFAASLTPYLGDAFYVAKNGNRFFLCRHQNMRLFVMDVVPKQAISLTELKKRLPAFKKDDVLQAINELLLQGKLIAQISKNATIHLQAVEEAKHIDKALPPPTSEAGRKKAIKTVFDQLHQQRDYVRICDVRRSLNWPKDIFDQTLNSMRGKEISLYAGADMSEDEAQDSYFDKLNRRFDTMMWRQV